MRNSRRQKYILCPEMCRIKGVKKALKNFGKFLNKFFKYFLLIYDMNFNKIKN